MVRLISLITACTLLPLQTFAQFPPAPEGITTIESRDHDGASLSYKQICETTPGVKSFSGYVNLPSTFTGETFNISSFYWYSSSRKDPENAPLSIYLAGGAADSSMDGAAGEGGPCAINADSNSTTLNPWSFNNEVNMLYIDQAPYLNSGRSAFDMSHQSLDPFPYYRQGGYFNQGWVQAALGVPVNFTDIASPGANLYSDIGDAIRGDVSIVEYILDQGYRVSLVFGDRDYRWLGGEAISLAANWSHAEDFRKSGYASVSTHDTYTGGYVRQAGKLSFARVFQAGHAVQGFQPETVSRIFTRSMFGFDVATGNEKIDTNKECLYQTKGPLTVRIVTEALPPMPEYICYTWAAEAMCTGNQLNALENGTAAMKDYYVMDPLPEYNAA